LKTAQRYKPDSLVGRCFATLWATSRKVLRYIPEGGIPQELAKASIFFQDELQPPQPVPTETNQKEEKKP
jgi:hypothetical protein